MLSKCVQSYKKESIKMELNKNLIWEVIRYHPKLAFIIECLNSTYNSRITSDVSYIQFLLEELYFQNDVRRNNLQQCKHILRELLAPSILVHFYYNSHKLRFFNFKTNKVATYPLLPFKENLKGKCKTSGKSVFKNFRVSWCLLSPSKVFFTDPWEPLQSVKNFSFETQTLK